MSRSIKKKELENTRLACNYGGWIYCNECNKTIGYLCYVTYGKFELKYTCNCGNNGKIFLELEDCAAASICEDNLVLIKNRLCCQKDSSPLFTVLDKNLLSYSYKVICNQCAKEYVKEVL